MRRSSALLLSVLLFITPALLAQTSNTGTLLGNVSDPSGAVIPGVEIKLQDAATKDVRMTVTNELGRYTFVGIRPGTYALSASLPGFQQALISPVEIAVSRAITINITLQIGQASETVEVTSVPGAELQVLDATVGNTLTRD